MVGERDEVLRGISLDKHNLLGYNDLMTRFEKNWYTMQIIQMNNFQPQQRQARRVQWNTVVEAELGSNGDDEVDERGRSRRQNNHPPSGIKLIVPSIRARS